MKKSLLILLASLMLFVCACRRGVTRDAVIDLGDSSMFSQETLEAAAKKVLKKFKTFKGCTLLLLQYEEASSVREVLRYHGTQDNPENSMVLFSHFQTDAKGGDGSLNPDFLYTDWTWVLTRDSPEDDWKVIDWGY